MSGTIRDQLAKHRATENCAGCHARIDPPGFALENYDVIGGWREKYRVAAPDRKSWVNNRTGPLGKYLAAWQYGLGPTVECGDAFPDGRTFASTDEFKKLLLSDLDAFNAAFRIPNFLQNLFGEGALSASFIPVYAALLARGERRLADRVAAAVAGLLERMRGPSGHAPDRKDRGEGRADRQGAGRA